MERRRPHQPMDTPTKRRSADVQMMMTMARSHELIASSTPLASTSAASAAASTPGHRRSSSYGNPTQLLWSTGITQQQSMPCINNLSLEQSPSYPDPGQSVFPDLPLILQSGRFGWSYLLSCTSPNIVLSQIFDRF